MIKRVSNKIKELKNIKILAVVLVLAVFFLFFMLMPKTQATSGDNIYGYAWSDNIGWISFNNCSSTVPTSCSGVDYGVRHEPTSDPDVFDVIGYAWSSNVGWIKFGGLSGFPNITGSGTTQDNAKIVKEGNLLKLKGWARVVAPSGVTSPSCMAKDNNNKGCWDGWISLSGNSAVGVPYGVTFALGGNPQSGSFAWGSNVVGWVDFSNVSMDPPVIAQPASSSLTGDSCVVNAPGVKVTLFWETIGMDSCVIWKDGSPEYTIPTGLLPSGSKDLPVESPSSVFSLNCITTNGVSFNGENLTVKRLNSCVPTPQSKKTKYKEI